MLFRFLFLIILAYLIARTVGNLLRAARGKGERISRGESQNDEQVNQMFDVRAADHRGSRPDDPRTRTANPGNSSQVPSPNADVEDAKWTDVE